VACSDKMIDNVGRGSVSTGTAEPLAASQTLDDTAGGMDAAVTSPRSACIQAFEKATTYAHA